MDALPVPVLSGVAGGGLGAGFGLPAPDGRSVTLAGGEAPWLPGTVAVGEIAGVLDMFGQLPF